jgi:hypothetical protein
LQFYDWKDLPTAKSISRIYKEAKDCPWASICATSLLRVSIMVVVNYQIGDESLLEQRINPIMGNYDHINGSLINQSSFQNGFIISNTQGTTQLATSLRDGIYQQL